MPHSFYKEKIELDDIPESHRDLAAHLGLEVFLELSEFCGGQLIYIPELHILGKNARDRAIRARFSGKNFKELAVQFRLSERQIRKIIKGYRT